MKLKMMISAVLLCGAVGVANASDSLIGLMGSLQYFSHKLSLSIDANNARLAGFYAHEVEEVIEVLEEMKDYKGKPIAKLVKSQLLPAFEVLEGKVKSGDMKAASGAFDNMLRGCNSCHTTTQHGFIKIQRSSVNPYMQSFDM